jgi:4-carboxymuconolactone decarboxylase
LKRIVPLALLLFLAGQAHAQPAPPAAGGASNFTGKATLSGAFRAAGGSRLGAGAVTFEPAARTNWHSHPLGQLLVVTAGRGWMQIEGELVRALKPGDFVWTPPGVKHWHGGTRTSGLTHVAVSEQEEGRGTVWLGPVSDAEFQGPE